MEQKFVFCSMCGTKNEAEYTFCLNCGNRLEAPPVRKAPEAVPAPVEEPVAAPAFEAAVEPAFEAAPVAADLFDGEKTQRVHPAQNSEDLFVPPVPAPELIPEAPVLSKKDLKAMEKAQKANRKQEEKAQKSANKAEKKQGKKKGAVIAIVILTVLCLAFAGFSGYMVYTYLALDDSSNATNKKLGNTQENVAALTEEVEELEAANADLEAELEATTTEKDATIAEQEAALKEKAEALNAQTETYNNLVKFMKEGRYGYGEDNFFVDDQVVVLKKGETAKLGMTAYWTGGGRVQVAYEGAQGNTIAFDETQWRESTTLTVRGDEVGVTRVTFSTTANSVTFDVLVVVTE